MKTTSIPVKAALIATLFILNLLPEVLTAQLANPYPVYNSLTCDVEISYKILDPLCNTVCRGTLAIAAGTTGNITCGNATPNFDDIFLTIVWIDDPSCYGVHNALATPYSTCNMGPGNSSVTVTTNNCGNCTSVTLEATATYGRIY